MWPTVTYQDLVDRWRLLTEDEQSVATYRIRDAENEIQLQLRARGLDVPPAGDVLWSDMYVRIVVDMVRRYMLNPEAWATETEGIDDYNYTQRRDSSVAAGLLYVSDDELEKLMPRRRRGAFTIAGAR